MANNPAENPPPPLKSAQREAEEKSEQKDIGIGTGTETAEAEENGQQRKNTITNILTSVTKHIDRRHVKYREDEGFWKYWNSKTWSLSPLFNRRKGNIVVGLVSIILSVLYLILALYLHFRLNRLRFVRDPIFYRSKEKFRFDVFEVYVLNIFLAIWLIICTFCFHPNIEIAGILLFLFIRVCTWINAVRNFELFQYAPYAYAIYNPSNPDWKWEFLSCKFAFWVSCVYYFMPILIWLWEFLVVTSYVFFLVRKLNHNIAVEPLPLQTLRDKAQTSRCAKGQDFKLLLPTPKKSKFPHKRGRRFKKTELTPINDKRFHNYP